MALDHLNWRRNHSPTSRVRPPWVNHPPTPQLSYRNRNIHGRGLLRLTFHAVLQGVKRLVGSSSYQACMVNKKSCSMHFLGDWAFLKPVTHDEWKNIKFACGEKPVKSRTCRAEHWRFEKQERSEHPQWRSAVSACLTIAPWQKQHNGARPLPIHVQVCRRLVDQLMLSGVVVLICQARYCEFVLVIHISRVEWTNHAYCQPLSTIKTNELHYAFNCPSRLNEDIVSQCLT